MLTLSSAESQDSTYLNCHETIHRVMCIVYVIATTGTGTDVYRYIGIVATSIYSIKIMNSRKKQWIGNERMAACTFEFGSEFGRCRMGVCVCDKTNDTCCSIFGNLRTPLDGDRARKYLVAIAKISLYIKYHEIPTAPERTYF